MLEGPAPERLPSPPPEQPVTDGPSELPPRAESRAGPAEEDDLRKLEIGRILFLRSCKTVTDALPSWAGFVRIDLDGERYKVDITANRRPSPEEVGRLKHTLQKSLGGNVSLSWRTADGSESGGSSVGTENEPRKAPPERSRARSGGQGIAEDIERSLPRGIELRKLSLFNIPMGRQFSTFAVLKVNIREVPEEAIDSWRSGIEAKHGIFVLLQNHRVSAGLNRQLSRIADKDGIIRDEGAVQRLQERLHGPVPRYEGPRERPEIPNLRDITSRQLITIDPAGALDNDDAIGAELLPNGNTRLTIAFADVAWRVQPGTPYDDYARKAVFTIYGRSSIVPLLGKELSLSELSLRPGAERLAYVVELEVDRSGKILGSELYRGSVKSHGHYTYREVQAVLGGAESPIRETVELLRDATARLKQQRVRKASLIKVEGEGESHGIVEECMLAAKHDIAKRFHQAGLPAIYKVHALPSREQRRIFVHQVKAQGIPARLRDFSDPTRFCALLGCLRDIGANGLVYRILDAYLGKARYDTRNVGHEGLRLDAYIEIKGLRNYAGVVNQRMAEKLLSGGEASASQSSVRKHCNEINRKNRAYSENTFKLLTLERIREGLGRAGEELSAKVTAAEAGRVLMSVEGFEKWGIFRATGTPPAVGDEIRVRLDGYDLRRGRFSFVAADPIQ